MKKYILLLLACVNFLIISCSEKSDKTQQTHKETGSFFSNLIQPEDGTPYTLSDANTHQQWTGLYRSDAIPETTKPLQIFQDSTYVINFNGHIYWDSLSGNVEIGNYNRILTIGTDGRMGVSKLSTIISTDFTAPSAGNSITSGTAFQPNSSAASFVLVNSSLSGIVGVNGTITIATSATSGGTYTTVVSDAMVIALLGIGAKSAATIPVPKGYWVKVTLAGGTAPISTYTKWSLQ